MVGTESGPLRCPYCAGTRFSRLAPPYSPLSVIRCAQCLNYMAIADLAPRLPRERPTSVENRADGASAAS